MSETFTLQDELVARRSILFAPPSKAMRCRQALWMKCQQANPNPVVLADFYKYEEEFSPGTVYRAAKTLVRHGILERQDISYGYIAKGQERTSYRIGVKFVEPFISSSRKWQN
jgi:hypothetical protein